MKSFLLSIPLLLSVIFLNAQVGINSSYKTINANVWETVLNENISQNQKYFKNGFSLGVDYWFRLKNKRIEFTPELSYSQFKSISINLPLLNETADLNLNYFSFQFNTNIYPFDFNGDCNCPTFSKDGSSIKKGFFIQISPGISYIQKKYNSTSPNTTLEINSENITPSIALGIGLDIGVSDFFTLTPYVKAQRHFGVLWENFQNHFVPNEPILQEKNTSDIDHLQFGIRLGFRFSELNKYGYR